MCKNRLHGLLIVFHGSDILTNFADDCTCVYKYLL